MKLQATTTTNIYACASEGACPEHRRPMPRPVEDPLTYLPHKTVQYVLKDHYVYDWQQPSDRLYVVLEGRVKVFNIADDGSRTVIDVISTEGMFGESCLVDGGHCEVAVALDRVSLMSWSRGEIEGYIEREPRLGLAMLQCAVYKSRQLQARIESAATLKTPARVMVAMAGLARQLGTPMPDGSMRVGPLTHKTIAEYIGTSREIVTFEMNRMRRMGLLQYTRKHIDVYIQAITEDLHQHSLLASHGEKAYRSAV